MQVLVQTGVHGGVVVDGLGHHGPHGVSLGCGQGLAAPAAQRPVPGPVTQLTRHRPRAKEGAKRRPVADGQAHAELVGGGRAATQLRRPSLVATARRCRRTNGVASRQAAAPRAGGAIAPARRASPAGPAATGSAARALPPDHPLPRRAQARREPQLRSGLLTPPTQGDLHTALQGRPPGPACRSLCAEELYDGTDAISAAAGWLAGTLDRAVPVSQAGLRCNENADRRREATRREGSHHISHDPVKRPDS